MSKNQKTQNQNMCSSKHQSWHHWCVYCICGMVLGYIVIVSILSMRLAFVSNKIPYAQSILVLGGDGKREVRAAQLAAQYPSLDIWVSSGSLPHHASEFFLAEQVSLSRVILDYDATDTVTNFTTLVAKLQENEIQHVYLITSDFHMRRSKAIAFWILGSHGIAYTPISVSSDRAQEPRYKVVRDIVRSWLWLLTGRTGSSLDPNPPVRSS